jgi:2-keto-4-pentenoate hydratase
MDENQLNRNDIVSRAATRLIEAMHARRATPPVRDLLGETDQQLAYDVQQVLTQTRLAAGARIVGSKIGLTSPAVRTQLGVDTPDTGVLFDDMQIPDGGTVDSSTLIQPRIEAEVAFVLKADLDGEPGSIDVTRAAAAVDCAVAALEIVDSRVQSWDIRITDTVADNASSALFVLGENKLTLDEVSPIDITMSMTKDGVEVSSGAGDPLNALVWLARARASLGEPLRAGEIVLSGALGPMVVAEPGSEFVAELSALGRVSVTFSR